MKILKSSFKNALKNCKQNNNKEILQTINEKIQRKNYKNFWNEVKGFISVNINVSIIFGRTSPDEIIETFTQKI